MRFTLIYVGMVHAKRDEIFRLGDHSFDSKVSNIYRYIDCVVMKAFNLHFTFFEMECDCDPYNQLVCMAGKWKKNVWKGPPRHVTKVYFERWAENLFLGMNDRDAAKIKKNISVQHGGGYQNEFLFAERLPETAPVWDVLRQEELETKDNHDSPTSSSAS